MTCDEFLSMIKSRGAHIAPPSDNKQILLLNAKLREHRHAMLPQFMLDLYNRTCGINLGNGYIFGPVEIIHSGTYPAPDIERVNNDFSVFGQTHGQTIFGRNDLFWFSFDAFGRCYMLDNLSLRPLRKYDNPYRALTDCLIAGKL